MKRLAIFVVLVLTVSACSSGTPLTFHNTSEYELKQVVLSGTGFESNLGAVAPGRSLKIKVHPTSESALTVSFIANDQHFSNEPQGYFEGGGMYKVTATVSRNLSVVVDSSVGLY